MKDICIATGLACIKCNPGACEHRHNNIPMDRLVKAIHKILLENKVTIRATSGADLLITDEETGEERVLPDLGYPF